MFEKFGFESKTPESKEMSMRHLAKEMLERFLARVRKSGGIRDVEHDEVSKTKETATEDMEEEKISETTFSPDRAENIESVQPEIGETIDSVKLQDKEMEKRIDKEIYESIVTSNYFEGWDEDVELIGNPEIKAQIRQNIIEAEKKNQRRYEDVAADLSISVEKFKEKLQAKIENMLKRSNFFIATQLGVLEKIMNVDGRWKTQFETGTGHGTIDPGFRAASEMRMFGFNKISGSEMPTDAGFPEEVLMNNKEKRPVYGYFSDEKHGAINGYGKIPPSTSVQRYGEINVKIKKERALKKSTVAFQDSLEANDWPPTPAAKPHFTSFRLDNSDGRFLKELKGPSVVNWGASYTEVQYHGQLTMDNVESIHISSHNCLCPEEIEEVRKIFKKYKEQNPESDIQLIEF